MIGVCGRGQRARLPERLAAVGAGRVGLGDVGRVGVEVEVVVGYRPGLGRHQAELDVGLLPGAPRASWIGRRVPRGSAARICRADFSSGARARARKGLARCWRARGWRAVGDGRRGGCARSAPGVVSVGSATGRIGHWSNRPLVKKASGRFDRGLVDSDWARRRGRGRQRGAGAGPRGTSLGPAEASGRCRR